MRRFFLIRAGFGPLAIVTAIMLGTTLCAAQTGDVPLTEDNTAATAVKTGAERLDGFFFELKRERDPNPAKRIADSIWTEWRKSGSATADQLMAWANEAMHDKRHFIALDLLDQVTVLMPDYAEGWNRRATLHYMMNNHSKSMADINRVLELEPRHFGALMGMGAILSEAGKDRAALGTYLKVLEVYPAMREAQTKVGQLSEELAGDEI
jgi:tetratricopeptide (TPR) repeat protein